MKVLGIILARGGSKTIPKKNIKTLNGKPLMAYTIDNALKSDVFDDFIVSTDDTDIASVALEYGAKVPFMRPDELSGDTIWSRDAVKHAVLECEKIYDKKYDYVMELPCTAPLRNENHIREAYQMLISNDVDSVTSVTRMVDKHPVRMKRIVDNLIAHMILWMKN